MELKKIIISALFVLATSTTSFASNVSEDSVNVALTASEIKSEMIRHERHRRQIAWELAPIKTQDQLKALIQQQSPLDMLSPEAKQSFVDSIVFGKSGLGGFKYSDLEAELTPKQIHEILSLFGAQHVANKLTGARIESTVDSLLLSSPSIDLNSVDYKNYRCASRATCESNMTTICMFSCYH